MWSPFPAAIAVLRAWAIPRRGSSTTRTTPPNSWAISALRSVEPLSTTTTSATGSVWASTLSIASPRCFSPLCTGIRAETPGSGIAPHHPGDHVDVGGEVGRERQR